MNTPICPYLGLYDDPDTHFSVPCEINYCHRLAKPSWLSEEYQKTYCMGEAFGRCVVATGARVASLSGSARSAQLLSALRLPPRFILGLFGILFTLGLIAGVLWLGKLNLIGSVGMDARGPVFPTGASPESPVVQQPAAAQTLDNPTTDPTLTGPAPATRTDESPSVVPPTALSPLGFETPLGSNPSLLIHSVLPGESLEMIADRYGTSVEAIQAINYFLPSPLWVALPLVVPWGSSEVSGLPRFEAYQVLTSGFTVKQLAESLQADPSRISQYNLLNEGTLLVAGQWLLIPR